MTKSINYTKKVLLLLVIPLFFIFLFINTSIPLVSAILGNSPDWSSFGGNQDSTKTNSQDTLSHGYYGSGNLYTVFNPFSNNGTQFYHPPLYSPQITALTVNSTQYTALTDGINLTVYDSIASPLIMINSGSSLYSLDLKYKNATDILISGYFLYNSENWFKTYSYNYITNSIYLFNSVNLTSYGRPNSNIRCTTSVCIGYYHVSANENGIFNFYSNGSVFNKSLDITVGSTIEMNTPSIISVNGENRILTNNEVYLYYTYQNGTIIFRRTVSTGYQYTDAVFYTITGGTYKIAVQEEQYVCCYTANTHKILGLNLDGTSYFSANTVYSGGASNLVRVSPISVIKYQNTDDNSLFLAFSNTSDTYLRILNSDGSLDIERTVNYPVLYNPTVYTRYSGYVINADMNNDDYNDAIITTRGFSMVYDLQNSVQLYNFTGLVIPTDINQDRGLELLGFNNTGIFAILNTYTPPQNETTISTITTNSSIVNSIVNPLLAIFPDSETLSFAQKMGLVLVIMFLTVVIIMYAGANLGDGMHSFLIYIILFILVIEFVFFISIAYISGMILFLIALVCLAVGYIAIKSRG